ncbi:hypothetical protein F511_30714 [Dorcoceras hygrometricum]|uniref:Uncharacterized protein n=1 Tax=Dorcoceras hygrometricum TaxID=472368 RepID=A0A2Z7B8A9_9LAMI|nr:hypothetical protein F511_30714 [Dorcoceras hygrometricum]
MTNGWFSKRRRTNLLKRRRILPAAGYPVARQNNATLLSAGSSRNLKTQPGTQTRSTSWYQTQHTNDVAPTNLNAVVLALNATTLNHLLITTLLIDQQELKRDLPADFTQTTAFQESRAKTRFDWFFHRPVASFPNQLTRHPAEHADPLGSLGLNGAGDDPAEFKPTGGEDI